MNSPLVSLITSVCNVENYIDRCLASVSAQSYPNLEILLMVGKCDDRSLEKCIAWQKRDERIVVVSRNDSGLGDARNYAFQIAQGQYIAYVDADDFVEETYVEKLLAPLVVNDSIDISCCGFDRISSDERAEEGWIPSDTCLSGSNLPAFLQTIPYGMVWLKMYRKDWLMRYNIKMFDGCHEDDAMHLCLAAVVKNIEFIQEPLYHYNVGNQKSLMHNQRQLYEYVPALRFAFAWFKEYGRFGENKLGLKRHVSRSLMNFIRKNGKNAELRANVLDFLTDYFPDIAQEIQRVHPRMPSEQLVLFGAGEDGRKAVCSIGREKIAYIVDNNPVRQGAYLEGLLIVPIDRLLEEKIPTLVLISSGLYYFEIAEDLRMHGINNYLPWYEYASVEIESSAL